MKILQSLVICLNPRSPERKQQWCSTRCGHFIGEIGAVDKSEHVSFYCPHLQLDRKGPGPKTGIPAETLLQLHSEVADAAESRRKVNQVSYLVIIWCGQQPKYTLHFSSSLIHFPPSLTFLKLWDIVILFIFLCVWPCCSACGILVPQAGIEPVPPAIETQSSNHWTATEVPLLFKNYWTFGWKSR